MTVNALKRNMKNVGRERGGINMLMPPEIARIKPGCRTAPKDHHMSNRAGVKSGRLGGPDGDGQKSPVRHRAPREYHAT
jgi:hypothetical protein